MHEFGGWRVGGRCGGGNLSGLLFSTYFFSVLFFSKSDFLIDRQLRRRNIQSERVDDGRRNFTMDKR